MQTEIQSVATQLNILTGVFAIASFLLGGLMALIKMSTGRQIDKAKSDLSKEIRDSEERLSKELARKDLMDARLAELDRRLTKTEAWKEAVSAVPPTVNGSVKT